MPTTFATWNINSVRLRLPLVLEFIDKFRPDILCLQEIKCLNDQFPKKEFTAAGYPYQAVHGQKGYHGVAIISKHPLTDISSRVFCEIEESRHVSAITDFGKGPTTVHNFYIPAGGDIADVELNPKFKHKVGFLNELKAWFGEDHFRERQLICGDFNIAPLEHDVWSHK
ncbi:MAG: exodeoxyribonuclease III, partial [Alphaproteobacteria bacterium]